MQKLITFPTPVSKTIQHYADMYFNGNFSAAHRAILVHAMNGVEDAIKRAEESQTKKDSGNEMVQA